MALQALIQNLPVAAGPDQISIFVQYYDDADPKNNPTPSVFLDQQNLLFAATSTASDVRTRVIDRGQALKGTLTRIAQIEQTFTPPITILIP